MLVKLKNSEFKTFYSVLEFIVKGVVINKKDVEFKGKMQYGVSLNVKKLKVNIESINDAVNKLLKKYPDELKEIQIKFSKKDNDNKPVIIQNELGVRVYDIPEKNSKKFKAATDVLNKKFEKELKARDEYLDSTEKFDIYVVSSEYFPDLPMHLADALFPMMKE